MATWFCLPMSFKTAKSNPLVGPRLIKPDPISLIGPGVGFDSPGFFYGVLHGLIVPISFVASLFTDITIYAFPNTGGWYNFGFVIGASGWAGGASGRRRFERRIKRRYERRLRDRD